MSPATGQENGQARAAACLSPAHERAGKAEAVRLPVPATALVGRMECRSSILRTRATARHWATASSTMTVSATAAAWSSIGPTNHPMPDPRTQVVDADAVMRVHESARRNYEFGGTVTLAPTDRSTTRRTRGARSLSWTEPVHIPSRAATHRLPRRPGVAGRGSP